MKKLGIAAIASTAAVGLQAIAGAVLLFNVFKLNMLPDVFALILVLSLAALLLTTGLLVFVKFLKAGKTRHWIAFALAIIICAGCFAGCHYVAGLRNAINNITTEEPSGIPMAVFVRNDDTASSISDAKDYIFAIVSDYETERTAYTIDVIEKQENCKLTIKSCPSVFDMVDQLYAGGVGALILNPAYADILVEMEGYEDFSEKTRILYEVLTPEVVQEDDATSPTDTVSDATIQTQEPTEPEYVSISERPFVIYLSGTDTTAKVFRTCRSDVNIIAVINPKTYQILLVNTPRDYYVNNPAGNNKPDKLTHCGMYGVENSVITLSQLYGIDIDYYARINFNGFEKLIDAIGGITVYSDASFTAGYKLAVQKGYNEFNGADALLFARERYHVKGGDNGRGKNQMRVISAVINKMTSSTVLISSYSEIISSLGDMFTMSIPQQEVSEMVKLQLDEMPKWEIRSFAVTGENGRNVTYSMPGRNLSVMYIDEDYVSKGTELINKVIAGELLTDDDLKMK